MQKNKNITMKTNITIKTMEANVSGTKTGDINDNTIPHRPNIIQIWGFRAPMINDYGDWYGSTWLLFNSPFEIEEDVFVEMFHEECREYRIFYEDKREEAELKWRNHKGDVWDQFWHQVENCPTTLEKLFNEYINILDKRNKRWLYNICEEEDEE